MFTFTWTEVALDDVVSRLYAVIGGAPPSASDHAKVVSLLVTLFGEVGGVPISDAELDGNQLSDLAARLLDDACRHTLVRLHALDMTPGYFHIDEHTLPFSRRAVAYPIVPVNAAGASELVPLPEIGDQLASRIIEGRHAGGPYSSPEELAERVSGIGPMTIQNLESVLSFAPPQAFIAAHTANLDTRFAVIAAIARCSAGSDPVIAALDLLCTVCGERPHPSSVDRRRRSALSVSPAGVSSDWISPLVGEEYYNAMFQLFDEAVASIEVCMFHIALGDESHPSFQLLGRLVAAVQRGVNVRVLLDCDRPTDPYNSTVVNRHAKEFLETNAVPVKFDPEDRLLHSKFVVLDKRSVVIGSHNWSVGSFFDFDDLSLAIVSPALAQEFVNRFDLLWQG